MKDLVEKAEKGITKSLSLKHCPKLAQMLGAVKAVKARDGEVDHIFELEAIDHGVKLHRKHSKA